MGGRKIRQRPVVILRHALLTPECNPFFFDTGPRAVNSAGTVSFQVGNASGILDWENISKNNFKKVFIFKHFFLSVLVTDFG
jgi:hypothetical protein